MLKQTSASNHRVSPNLDESKQRLKRPRTGFRFIVRFNQVPFRQLMMESGHKEFMFFFWPLFPTMNKSPILKIQLPRNTMNKNPKAGSCVIFCFVLFFGSGFWSCIHAHLHDPWRMGANRKAIATVPRWSRRATQALLNLKDLESSNWNIMYK